MRKILRSLPRLWEAKVTAIQEAKNLNTLSLEELLGSLMTHELIMKQHSEEETKRKKKIALKTTVQEENSEKSENSEEDEDLELITKKFRRFIRKRRQETKRKPPVKGEPSKQKRKRAARHLL